MKKRHIVVAIISFIILLSTYYVFSTKENPHIDEELHSVKLLQVPLCDEPPHIIYPGKVRSVRHASLFFRVSGPVIKRDLKLGQFVEEGTILMEIDPRDYVRNVEVITQELTAAQAQLALADKEYKRYAQLLATKDVSQAKFDTIKSQQETANAQVEGLKTSLKIAQDKLNDTVLKAPFKGSISRLDIEQYEYANANQTVVVLDDLSQLEVRVYVPSKELSNIELTQKESYLNHEYTVSFPSHPDKTVKAHVYEVSHVSDDNELYEVVLRFNQPKDFLILPGMSAEIKGNPQPISRSTYAIPYSAIFETKNHPCVWVYTDNKLELRTIIIQEETQNKICVQNLKEGELIVATGGEWLTQDMKVNVLNPEILK